MQQSTPIHSIYFWCSLAVVLYLIFLLSIYTLKWRHTSTAIMQVLIILLINELLESLFEMLSYMGEDISMLCTVSLIGRVAFTVAANFWIVFIMRLIYKEALAPGKYFDLVRFFLKNIVLAYVPSIVLSVFLLIVLLIGDTKSEAKCWTIIASTELMDYIIYGTSFILPSLATSSIVLIYFILYFKLPNGKWTIFLLFPITALIFSFYYLAVKIYFFSREENRMEQLEIPFLLEPIIYGILFVIIYRQQAEKALKMSSSISLDDNDIESSFVDF